MYAGWVRVGRCIEQSRGNEVRWSGLSGVGDGKNNH